MGRTDRPADSPLIGVRWRTVPGSCSPFKLRGRRGPRRRLVRPRPRPAGHGPAPRAGRSRRAAAGLPPGPAGPAPPGRPPRPCRRRRRPGSRSAGCRTTRPPGPGELEAAARAVARDDAARHDRPHVAGEEAPREPRQLEAAEGRAGVRRRDGHHRRPAAEGHVDRQPPARLEPVVDPEPVGGRVAQGLEVQQPVAVELDLGHPGEQAPAPPLERQGPRRRGAGRARGRPGPPSSSRPAAAPRPRTARAPRPGGPRRAARASSEGRAPTARAAAQAASPSSAIATAGPREVLTTR